MIKGARLGLAAVTTGLLLSTGGVAGSADAVVQPQDDVRCLTPADCHHAKPSSPSGAVSQCLKASAAAAAVGAAGTAATTSPIDVPGIVTIAMITYEATYFFCSIGWHG